LRKEWILDFIPFHPYIKKDGQNLLKYNQESHFASDLSKVLNESKFVKTKIGFFPNSKLYSISNVFEFLKLPPVNLVDKLRLGLAIIVASLIKD
jgi:hypothetical protein